ncbi:MAG: ABC transporter substrate-binding protein [Pseudonocardiaceae bacterium]
MTRSLRRGAGLVAVALVGVLLAAACGGESASHPGSGTTPGKGDTVTFAEAPGSTPNYIFPITPTQQFNVPTISGFQYLMYRPLYWAPSGDQPVIDDELSLAEEPIYSQNNTIVTVNLKTNYQWSDGEPVDARDVVFSLNLFKAAVKESPANFGNYTPGEIPDNLASYTATGKYQLTFTLNRSVNPEWFTTEQLELLTPLPLAWDKTSASGPSGDYDLTSAGAKQVYDFLAGQAADLSSYATNPLWQVVDGPWHLTSFSTTGQLTMAANPHYGGPYKPAIAHFEELPFTSEAAEFNQVRAGAIDVGYVPTDDLPQLPAVKRGGYHVFAVPQFFIAYVNMNFNNPVAGPIFKQLYIRQALQHLVDQPAIIHAIYSGHGIPAYGPVPVGPPNPYASALEKQGTYPYSVSAARQLLSSHGWSVILGGVDTCVNPGTAADQCGAGIARGAKLQFTLDYANAIQSTATQVSALKSDAARVGIQLDLRGAPFNTILAQDSVCTPNQSGCAWQMSDFGGIAFSTYPTGDVLFETGGALNSGSYSDPTADTLIAATLYGSDPNALTAYQDYIARQLPVLFQPDPDAVVVVKSTLATSGTFTELTQGNLQPERWHFRS